MHNSFAGWLIKQRMILLLAIFLGFLWSWIFLIDATRLSSSQVTGYITVTAVFLIIVSITTAIFYQAIKYLKREIKSKQSGWLIIIKIIGIWALAEAFIAWAVAIIWMGPNGSLDNILPFASLTPLLMWTPLGYLSRFFGFWGLSAVIVAGIACLIVKRLRKYAIGLWSIIIMLTFLSWLIYRVPTGPTLRVTTVSEHLGSPKLIKPGNSQLIVLPEYGLDNFMSSNINSRILGTNKPVYFVGSQQNSSAAGYTNNLVFGNNQKGFIKTQQKSRLIPGGEYLAYDVIIFLRIFDNATYTNFQLTRAVNKGSSALEPYKINQSLVVGSAVCSSIIQPSDYRRLTNEGATILTNSASLEIFKGSRVFNWQHRGLAKFMAIANDRPFVQASNNWPAFVLDNNGRQLAEVNPVGTSQVNLKSNTRKTPYSLFGEWPVYAGAIILIAQYIKRRLGKTKKTK